MTDDLSGRAAAFYDFVTPEDVIVLGRVVVLLFALATVALGIHLARRLGGSRAALVAGLLLALCPALVQRSSVVIVDTVASFFVLASLAAAERLARALEPGGDLRRALSLAFLAGGLAGLAAAAKYPAGAVVVATVTTILLFVRSPVRIARLLLGAGLGAAAGAIAGMPAFVLRARAVLDAMREQSRLYGDPSLFTADGPGPALFAQAFYRYELGLLLPVLAVAAWAVLLASRDTRRLAASWGCFALVFLVPALLHRFQPFRYVLPLVAPCVIGCAVVLARISARFAARQRLALAAALSVVALSFVPGLLMILKVRGARDSRRVLVDWLAEARPQEGSVLVVRELAILPGELARLPGTVRVAPWRDVRRLAESGQPGVLVFGRLDLAGSVPPAGAGEKAAARAYETWAFSLAEVARFGSVPTPLPPNFWRSNEELIVVARLPGPSAGP